MAFLSSRSTGYDCRLVVVVALNVSHRMNKILVIANSTLFIIDSMTRSKHTLELCLYNPLCSSFRVCCLAIFHETFQTGRDTINFSLLVHRNV
jgi:hypothetical protein